LGLVDDGVEDEEEEVVDKFGEFGLGFINFFEGLAEWDDGFLAEL
jgi:hypothetical protein